jgi:succinate-acetate transporter protein
MKKIAEFFSKWAFAIFLILMGVALLFALACCVYTAVENALVGIAGCVGVVLALAVVIGWLLKEIKEG